MKVSAKRKRKAWKKEAQLEKGRAQRQLTEREAYLAAKAKKQNKGPEAQSDVKR